MTAQRTISQPVYGKPGDISAALVVAEPELRDQTLRALRSAGVNIVGDFSAMASIGEIASAIDRVQPDLLLLGFAGLPLDPIEAVRHIRNLKTAPKVVVVNGSAESGTILQAMRAGASEFLYPPLEGQLAEALSRAAAERVSPGTRPLPGGRVVAFLSAKGGCGATTLACHVAGYLHRRFKKRVLLADVDFASGNAGLLMGTDQRYNIMDALDHLNRLDTTLWKSLAASTAEGPDFIAAPPEPIELAGRADSLASLMRFWRSQYDYTVVDLGHGLTPATCALMGAFDSLALVTTAEMPALRLAKQIIGTIGGLGVGPIDGGPTNDGGNRLRLVVNRMPRRAPIQLPELERIMGFPIYSVIPNEYQLLAEAYAAPKLLDPASTLGIPIAALAAKISGAPQELKKTRRLGIFS